MGPWSLCQLFKEEMWLNCNTWRSRLCIFNPYFFMTFIYFFLNTCVHTHTVRLLPIKKIDVIWKVRFNIFTDWSFIKILLVLFPWKVFRDLELFQKSWSHQLGFKKLFKSGKSFISFTCQLDLEGIFINFATYML